MTVLFDSVTGECPLPSSYFVQIFYSKINTQSNPQYHIVSVQTYIDSVNPWVYKNPDPTQK